jgi:hypothetical protein
VGTTAALGNMLGGLGMGGAGAAASGGVPLPPPRPGNLGAVGQALGAGGGAAAGGGGISGMMKQALPLMALAGALGGGGSKNAPAPSQEYTDEQRRVAADNARPLEQVSNVRFQRPTPARNYLRYGMAGEPGEEEFYGNNRLPATQRAATGGYVTPQGVLSRMAEGGSVVAASTPGLIHGEQNGRHDRHHILAADNEYIVDAETVSLLGDGSPEAGAAMLDRLREQVRKHKGRDLAQGRFSDDAREPQHYMKGPR